jgi:cytoskeletal protein RodZ
VRQHSAVSRFAAVALGAGLAVSLAACSKSDESSSASSSSSTTTSTASESSTTAASQVNCTELQSALSNVSSITSQVTEQGGSVNLEQFKVDLNQMKQDVSVISAQVQAANAPAQAAQLYTQRNEAVVGLLEQLGQTKNQQAFQQGFAQYQTPEYTAAAATVGAALKAQCPNLTD